MIICKWFNNSELQMTLSKANDTYYLDDKEIDKETACKLQSLNYENAKEICNE